jgi:hypothetical protein
MNLHVFACRLDDRVPFHYPPIISRWTSATMYCVLKHYMINRRTHAVMPSHRITFYNINWNQQRCTMLTRCDTTYSWNVVGVLGCGDCGTQLHIAFKWSRRCGLPIRFHRNTTVSLSFAVFVPCFGHRNVLLALLNCGVRRVLWQHT